MPVVARSIQIQSGTFPLSQFFSALLLILICLCSSDGMSQDSAASALQEPLPASTPVPATGNVTPQAEPEPVTAGCLEQILEQQKLTRTIREIRNPLPRPEKAAADKLKRSYSEFLSKGFTGADETKIIQDFLTYRLMQATDPDFVTSPSNMQTLLRETENDLLRCGSAIGNPTNLLAARKKYCAEVLKVAKQLLDNNLDARFAAVTIMPMLQEVRAVPNGAAARLHGDALVSLLAVLGDKSQPDSVKAVTASAIRKVLRNSDIVEQDQFRICDSIGAELSRPCTEAAYQIVLLDALFEITKPRRTVGAPEPTAMKIFAAVLDDKSKPLEVRCQAAMGIGRGAFDLQMKLDPLAWRIATLAGETAVEFNKQPGNPKWADCGLNLLLAFRHISASEATAPQLDRKGLMNRDEKSAVISGAAPFVTMVSVKLAENKSRFTVQELQPLAAWIQANQPASLIWDASVPPIKTP
jgi:hypothetical protein